MPGRRQGCMPAVAARCRSDSGQSAKAGEHDGRNRDRRARLYERSLGIAGKQHSTNLPERLNGAIKRRSDVVGISPNQAAITYLVGAILLEQNAKRLCSAPAT
jgi:transposase-like protein